MRVLSKITTMHRMIEEARINLSPALSFISSFCFVSCFHCLFSSVFPFDCHEWPRYKQDDVRFDSCTCRQQLVHIAFFALSCETLAPCYEETSWIYMSGLFLSLFRCLSLFG